MVKMKTARPVDGPWRFGRTGATSVQSLIHSRTNSPGPKDVAMVSVMVDGGESHWPERKRRTNVASIRSRYGRCRSPDVMVR